MKHNSPRMPDWLKRDVYARDMTLEELSYEVWVRANYMRRGPEPRKPIFLTFSKNEPRGREICRLFSGVLPVSREDYQEFLNNNFHFREHYAEQVNTWRSMERGPALQIYGATNNPIMSLLSLMPELAPSAPLQCGVADFFDEGNLCSPNLECSDEEIIGEFRKYLKDLRRQNAELRGLAKDVTDGVKKFKSSYIFYGGRLLALFDLLYWRETYSDLTYAEIGEVIWPGEGLNIDQRIKKVGIPAIEQFFMLPMAKALFLEHANRFEADLLGTN